MLLNMANMLEVPGERLEVVLNALGPIIGNFNFVVPQKFLANCRTKATVRYQYVQVLSGVDVRYGHTCLPSLFHQSSKVLC